MPVGSIFCKKQAKNGFLFPVSCFIMNHNTKDEYTAMTFREDAHMKIAVLCGGLSRERDVSISTGTCVAAALRGRGHEVALIDLFLGDETARANPEGAFSAVREDSLYSVRETEPDLEELRRSRGGRGLLGPGVPEVCSAADFVFLALHGAEGENGKLQAYLDLCGIPYTGSGYIGSALAMNKELTKEMFENAGVPTPPGITLNRGSKLLPSVGFPCVVKPCSGGSSVGTAIVEKEEDYDAALAAAFACDDAVLVEKYIKGRELTVGILGGRAMPVIEIIPKTGFYDYKNKYQVGLTEEICPAPLSLEDTERVQRLAEKAFAALKMDAYGRADFLMDETDGKLYCLEINSLPGMTPTSLIPQMAAAEGMTYGELCEKIIEVSRMKYDD